MKNHFKPLNIHSFTGLGPFLEWLVKLCMLLLLAFFYSCLGPSHRTDQMVPVPTETQEFQKKPAWKTKIEQGDRATQQKNWSAAARLYNEALDLMDNPRATPEAPSDSQIKDVIRRASHAQLLASSDSHGTRSLQNCRTMMRNTVRGVTITTHIVSVEFGFDKTTFTEKGKRAAKQLAKCLEKQGGVRSLSHVTLIGHTDGTGDSDYNYNLSVRRANALKSYFKKQGVTLNMATEGRGENEPVRNPPATLTQAEIDQLNRRVEIRTD